MTMASWSVAASMSASNGGSSTASSVSDVDAVFGEAFAGRLDRFSAAGFVVGREKERDPDFAVADQFGDERADSVDGDVARHRHEEPIDRPVTPGIA